MNDSSAASAATPVPPERPLPWWRFGHVWLVFSGPAIVVVAGFITLYIAITRSDPLVDEDYYRKGLALSHPAPSTPGLAPSENARNHAQTGVPAAVTAPSRAQH